MCERLGNFWSLHRIYIAQTVYVASMFHSQSAMNAECWATIAAMWIVSAGDEA